MTQVTEAGSPDVRRRELGSMLRAMRQQREFTVEQVAQRLLCSPSKISRIETGHRRATARDVRDLCDLYEVTSQAERDRMMRLADEAKQPAWWRRYDLPYDRYVGLEAEATTIRTFQSSAVPGLLQTADYARAGHLGAWPLLAPDEIERRVEARLKRQEVLARPDPPVYSVILDEAVLRRLVGGPQVMLAQLAKMAEIGRKLANVSIRVIPFVAGAHPAMESNFTLLELPPPTPGVVFAEGLSGSAYLEKPEDLDRYRTTFERLEIIALEPHDTLDLIEQLRGNLAAQRRD